MKARTNTDEQLVDRRDHLQERAREFSLRAASRDTWCRCGHPRAAHTTSLFATCRDCDCNQFTEAAS